MSGGASGDGSRQTVILFSVSRKNKFRYFRIKKKNVVEFHANRKKKIILERAFNQRFTTMGGKTIFFVLGIGQGKTGKSVFKRCESVSRKALAESEYSFI